jgi:hypothetical protein
MYRLAEGAQLTSYPRGIGVISPGMKRPECEIDHSPPHLVLRLRMGGAVLYFPYNALKAWTWTALHLPAMLSRLSPSFTSSYQNLCAFLISPVCHMCCTHLFDIRLLILMWQHLKETMLIFLIALKSAVTKWTCNKAVLPLL